MKDDRGAVAVFVAILVVPLLVTASFAVEFGLAYANSRQLSTAADAGALAAARYYASQTGDCPSLTASSPYYQQASSLAQQYVSANVTGATLSPLVVSCTSYGGLTVAVSDRKSQPTTIGALTGVGNITTKAGATGEVFVPELGAGLQPYAVCINDVLDLKNHPNEIRMVTYNQSSSCGYYNGDWYTVDCPEDATQSSAINTFKACTTAVTIIPTTPGGVDNSVTEPQLYNACLGQPPSADPGCLRGRPGDIRDAAKIASYWGPLLGKTILLPVIYPNTVSAAAPVAGGSTTRDPVAGFVAVQVCGYHWGPITSKAAGTPQSFCPSPDKNTGHYDAGNGTPVDNYLLLVFSSFISGGASSPSGCGLGSTCDYGNRGVSLIK